MKVCKAWSALAGSALAEGRVTTNFLMWTQGVTEWKMTVHSMWPRGYELNCVPHNRHGWRGYPLLVILSRAAEGQCSSWLALSDPCWVKWREVPPKGPSRGMSGSTSK